MSRRQQFTTQSIVLTTLLVGLLGTCSRIGRAAEAEWSQPHLFRVTVQVHEFDSERKNCPVGVAIDFGGLLTATGGKGRLDRDSIRVAACGEIVPHTTTGDLANLQKGTVWWRIKDNASQQYQIYFDTVRPEKKATGENRTNASRSEIVGLVGVGDTFHYNHGRTATANVLPLHSQSAHVDWDGDGRRDLIGWGYRAWEHGESIGKGLGNAVYFLKNVGTKSKPVFTPRIRLKSSGGEYLTSDLLPQNMIPSDWDGDGDTDFHGMGRAYQLLVWNNSGKRDQNGLLLLDPPNVEAKLDAESEFRAGSPGILRKRRAWYPRGVRRVDWEGDGDLDLLVGYRKVSRLRVVDASRGVMPYGTAVMVFDLFENTGSRVGEAEYARPVTLRESTGFAIRARGHANGGPAYLDWDGDGDFDLLFHDETARPLEGGRLMFAENRGSRAEPLLAVPIPILPISDSPFVVDWNDDGLLDVIAGGEFFENVNPNSRASKEDRTPGTVAPRTAAGTRIPRVRHYPKFVSRGLAQQIRPQILTYFTVSVDWEGDGDLDLVGGYQTGLRLFINRGTTLSPVFDPPLPLQAAGQPIFMPNGLDPQADEPSSFGPQGPTEAIYGWLCPTIGDWDNDGDLDLFATGQRWQTQYFENIGSRTHPRFAAGREVRCNGNTDEFSWRSKNSSGDLDGDGQNELVVTSDRDNTFYMYELNTKQPDRSALEFHRGAALKLENGEPVKGWYGGQNNNGDNHSLLVDWDNDGDLDLLNGTLWAVWYYENVGTRRKARFRAHGRFKVGDTDLHTFNHAGSFDAADWNEDGRLDLVLGTECPSDQPQGAVLHLFDRWYLENKLPKAHIGPLERRTN